MRLNMRLKGEKKRETYDKVIFITNIVELLQGKQLESYFCLCQF